MDYLNIGDKINYPNYNALVYLLRKFKKLKSQLKLGPTTINTDYGLYNFSNGLTSIGGNYIIEDDVIITATNCFTNSFYNLILYKMDVNLSGEVNKEKIVLTGETGETGEFNLLLPTDLLSDSEVLLSDFTFEITFDEHEYYTPYLDYNISLECDKHFVIEGAVATVTATVTDLDNLPVPDFPIVFDVNGQSYGRTTDENGVAVYEYTGTGSDSTVIVRVIDKTVSFEDKSMGVVTATFTGGNIGLGGNTQWLPSNTPVEIDWGDGLTDTVNNPTTPLSHTYTDGESSHTITFIGDITSLGRNCFYGCTGLTSIVLPDSIVSLGQTCFYGCTGLTSIVLPDSVTSLGEACFRNCFGLTSVTIPNSITSLGDNCFMDCDSLVDYQLYWKNTGIIQYDEYVLFTNDNTVFTIPYGETQNYIAKQYPSTKLTERASGKKLTTLSIQSSKSSYYTDETITITGILLDENNIPLTNTAVKIYQNNTLLETLTTDNDGTYEKTLTGLTAGAYTYKTEYEGDNTYEASTSTNLNITVNTHTYNITITADKQSILTTESVTVSGVLTKDNAAWANQTVTLYDGVSVIATLTTDSNGRYEQIVSGLAAGTHIFQAINTNVVSSTITVTVEQAHDYNLVVASTKDILSYADGESATITGTLTDGGAAVAGETLSYVIKHGTTTIDSGSDTTDANGEISFTYASTGIGDVTVEVDYSTLLQETFVLEDCFYNSAMTSSDNHWTIPSNANATYSNDGMRIAGSSWADCYLEIPITVPSTIEFDLIDYSGSNPYQMYWFNSTKAERKFQMYRSEQNRTVLDYYNSTSNQITYTIPKGSHVKIQFNSNTVELYVDDVLKLTKSSYSMVSPYIFGVATGGSRSTTYKNIKVKAL